jgi:hypothetical protein
MFGLLEYIALPGLVCEESYISECYTVRAVIREQCVIHNGEQVPVYFYVVARKMKIYVV